MSKKSWELSEEELNETVKLSEYNRYVFDQRPAFESLINFINNLTKKLNEDGEISDLYEIRARIKAPKSAIYNDEQKALDDVFGMEIITATEEESKKVIDCILKYMNVIREKNHNKKNGYKAYHKLLGLKSDILGDLDKNYIIDYVPLIEVQFKTVEVAVKCSGGTADHTVYKGHSKEDIQRQYDNGEFSIYTNIPTMWVSRNGELKLLSPDETLKKMYPFLKIKEKNNEKGDKK